MAEIFIRNTNERISGEERVREFLESYQVLYEHWMLPSCQGSCKKTLL